MSDPNDIQGRTLVGRFVPIAPASDNQLRVIQERLEEIIGLLKQIVESK